MIKLGTSQLLFRGDKPGQCNFCSEVIQRELYFVLRQRTRVGVFFYRYLHTRCISEFLYRTWERLERKPSGRPTGSKLSPEDQLLRRKYSQRYRYLEKRIMAGVSIGTLVSYFEEYDRLELWLKEHGAVTTIVDRYKVVQSEKSPSNEYSNKATRSIMKLSARRQEAAAGIVTEITNRSQEGTPQLAGVYYTPGKRRVVNES